MIKEVLIDTNVVVRLFDTSSEPEQTSKAKRLFMEAQAGSFLLVVAPPVLFEIAWVLRSSLKWPNSKVLDILEAIVNWPGVKVLDKAYVKTALSIGRRHNNSFADSYLAATAKDRDFAIATFDEKHFKKLEVALHEIK